MPRTKAKTSATTDSRTLCAELNAYQQEHGIEPYGAIYRCSHCGKFFTTQEANFHKTPSPLYSKNNGYGTICKFCAQKIFDEYAAKNDNDLELAMEVVCHLCELPWDPSVLEQAKEKSRGKIVENYVAALNMSKYVVGLSYEDTLIREYKDAAKRAAMAEDEIDATLLEKGELNFGDGYTSQQLEYLQRQYEDWTSRHECQTKVQEELFKNICIVQLEIRDATQAGRSTKDAMKTLQDLMDSANIKPKQQTDNSLVEQNTFGTLIQRWEQEKPIPEPSPEWRDVDNIGKYITVWFQGHLSKMFGFKNDAAAQYEEEVAKYTVEPPYYGDDSLDDVNAPNSEAMFGSVNDDGDADVN